MEKEVEMEFDGFDWDLGNGTKNLKKHGISTDEIEEVFLNKPFIFSDYKHSLIEKRYIAFGETNMKKKLLVAFAIRERFKKILIRPISARAMHKKEKIIYEKVSAKN